MLASTNKTVKWDFKSLIVCKKKVDGVLIYKVLYWVLRNSNIHKYLIARDTLLIDERVNGDWTHVTKLFLECSVQVIHNELIVHASEVGLEEEKYLVTGEMIIPNNILRHIIPGQISHM